MLSVQVNLRTIVKNVTTVKKYLHNGTKICAVVKADAYGLGMIKISKILAPLVDCFAVATVTEGVTLRQNGIQQDILVFGICEDVPTAIKHNLIITVENTLQANTLQKSRLHPRIHLAINTGMNRFGIGSVHELREILHTLSSEQIEGVYTHLAYESNQIEAVKSALNRFQKFTKICKKYFPQVLVHAGCSGVINYPAAQFDMVRIGKAFYGGITETQTAITVSSQIAAIKKIKAGSTVGYSGTYVTSKPTIVGIVRGGYANGIPTQFSNTVSVMVGKQRCPIIGRVCMDYFFLDVSKVAKPLTQKVTIISPQHGQTLIEVAQQANMVTCDLLQRITSAQKKY